MRAACLFVGIDPWKLSLDLVHVDLVGIDLPAAEIADQEVAAELAETGLFKATPQGDWRFPFDFVSEAICFTNLPLLCELGNRPTLEFGASIRDEQHRCPEVTDAIGHEPRGKNGIDEVAGMPLSTSPGERNH